MVIERNFLGADAGIFRQNEVLMKKIPLKRIFAAAALVCCLTVTTAYADVTQEDIDNAKNQINNLKNQQKDAQDAVDDINGKKGELESDLNNLNGQMTNIVSSMNALESQINDKKKELSDLEDEIEQTQDDLEAAKQQSASQYEDMKIRIRYMYENGNTPMLEMLLSASSFSDFLNRTEYISEINSYDRQKLEEFIQVQEQIAAEEASLEEQKKDLESEQQELLAMQDDMKVKQNSVNSLISSTQANISQTNSELSSAQGKVNDINSQIAQMEELEKQLEIQKAKEDAARMAEIKRQEAENNGEFSYVPSDSDLYLLGAIIQCEADGEPYEGKLAVGSVVMNRVRSSYFPNTVSGVIYQSGQFSPVASGRYALRLEQGVNNTCMQAAQEVLNGNITNSCLYFRTVIDGLEGTIIGHHIFY